MRILKASELCSDIYRVFDDVLSTGEAVVIEHNGRLLRIVAEDPSTCMGKLVRRPGVVVGDSEDLVHVDWSGALGA